MRYEPDKKYTKEKTNRKTNKQSINVYLNKQVEDLMKVRAFSFFSSFTTTTIKTLISYNQILISKN